MKNSLLDRMLKALVPGGLHPTYELMGPGEVLKRILKISFSYIRTFVYLLFKKGPRAAYNFFYVKTLVPCGEGAGAGFYFFIGPIIRKFPNLAPFPRYIEIEITTICNKRCIHCEHTYWKDQEEKFMSLDEFTHIYKQFPKVKWMHLTGEGSSFLNPDFVKMLSHLKQRDICVYLVDHFNDITEQDMKSLIDMGVDGTYISIDGATSEVYDKIRLGCKLEKVVENVKKFLKLKKGSKKPVPELSFRFVVNNLNVREMPLFVELIASLGDRKLFGDAPRIDFSAILEYPEIKHLYCEEIPRNLIDKTIENSRKAKIDVYFSHIEKGVNPPIDNCLCWLEPYITVDGYVLSCCTIMMSNRRTYLREISFGNVFKESFKDIWYSERYKEFRKSVNDKKGKVPRMCIGCRAYNTKERQEKFGVDNEL